MKAVFVRRCALLLALPLAACASLQGRSADEGGVEVTRFHLGQQVARGQIAIEPFNAPDANLPEFRSYASAVSAELTRLGWTVVDTMRGSEQVALIDVDQGARARLEPSRVGTGPASSTGQADDIVTRLEVRIRRRSDGTVFWDGRALTETRGGAAATQPMDVVQNLAAALFRDFPGESGRTISVR